VVSAPRSPPARAPAGSTSTWTAIGRRRGGRPARGRSRVMNRCSPEVPRRALPGRLRQPAGGVPAGAVSGVCAGQRRRTGIEPADGAARRPSVLKTGGATRHPDASGTRPYPPVSLSRRPRASRQPRGPGRGHDGGGPVASGGAGETRPGPGPAYRVSAFFLNCSREMQSAPMSHERYSTDWSFASLKESMPS